MPQKGGGTIWHTFAGATQKWDTGKGAEIGIMHKSKRKNYAILTKRTDGEIGIGIAKYIEQTCRRQK